MANPSSFTHDLSKKEFNPDNISDVKDVPKRTFQIGIILPFLCLIYFSYYIFHGIYLSASILSGYGILIGITLWLNYRGLVRYTKLSIVIIASIYITINTFSDGLISGGYLFYFSLLFGITILVDSRKWLKELVLYYSITITTFFIGLCFADANSKWQQLTSEEYQQLFYTNATFSFLLCIGFGYLYLFFERKYAEALVEQKNKAEAAAQAQSRFLSNMSHELRTPLNGIIGTIDILTKSVRLPEQEGFLNILKYCSDHMLQQVNDILDYNKIEAGKLELHPVNFNLQELLLKSILPFYNRFEEKKLILKVEVDNRLNKVVLADDIRLIQILNNLISNALKFTDKGYVELRAKCEHHDNDTLTVKFMVKDTGIGISREDQKRIFENFSQILNDNTREFGGTGLGLSITRKILEMMGSDLELYSEIGVGTEFTFDISFKIIDKERKESDKLSYLSEDLKGLKILAAEDNIINMMILKKLLLDWNVSVLTTCVNGKEALEQLSISADYNLILLDLEMPEMNGYETIKIIKKLYPEIPVIAFTASLVDNEMYKELLAQGFCECILKPFQSQHLLAKIKEYASYPEKMG